MGCLASAGKVGETVQAATEQASVPAETAPEGPKWEQLSLTGKKRALLIGINYIGQKGELRGCINDVIKIKEYLIGQGFHEGEDNMLILTEQEDGPDWPTRERMVEGMQWLVDGAASGDNLFFHYSGHGTRVADTSGDEKDGFDEALVPFDYNTAGVLIDDDVNRLICDPLPNGARLTIIMDCCHSGSACDLPYGFMANKKNTMNWRDKIPEMILKGNWQELLTVDGLKNALAEFTSTSEPQGQGAPGFRQLTHNLTPASVVMFSGCKDDQTSADVFDISSFELPEECGPGGAGGACTTAFLQAMHAQPEICFIDLLEQMRKILEEKNFTQVPMLSSSKIIPLGSPFCLTA